MKYQKILFKGSSRICVLIDIRKKFGNPHYSFVWWINISRIQKREILAGIAFCLRWVGGNGNSGTE